METLKGFCVLLPQVLWCWTVLCTPSAVGRDALASTRWSATTLTLTCGSLRSRTRWPSPVLPSWPWTDCSMWLVGKTAPPPWGPCWQISRFDFIFYLLIGGAVLEDGDGTDLAQVYNPKSGAWTELAPMQIARSGSAACTLKGKIYVIGEYGTRRVRWSVLRWSRMLPLLSKEGGTHQQRTRIKWSATIQKPTSGPCVPPWRNGGTGPALLWWTGRSTSWEEKKVGTGEGFG